MKRKIEDFKSRFLDEFVGFIAHEDACKTVVELVDTHIEDYLASGEEDEDNVYKSYMDHYQLFDAVLTKCDNNEIDWKHQTNYLYLAVSMLPESHLKKVLIHYVRDRWLQKTDGRLEKFAEFVKASKDEEKTTPKRESEKDYQQRVVDNFDTIFPDYTLIAREYRLPDHLGIADIIAKCNITGKDVIIELKIDKTDPKRQLLAYSFGFGNPILVALNREEVPKGSRNSRIIYKTYK